LFLIIAYIVGSFLGALGLKELGSRWPAWILLGSCALVCAAYLMRDQMPLPEFSISSLWVGQTRASDSPATSATEETTATRVANPGASWLVKFGTSIIAADFSGLDRIGRSSVAARIGAGLYLIGALVVLARPRYGLYLILFFALVGDTFLLPWYPFLKGFSARESLFFLHDAFIISPLELYILLIGISWFAWQVWRDQLRFVTGQLFWPTLVFLAFLLFGFARGIGTGGDLRIALWEMRAIFYLLALMVLTTNLVETTAQVSHLIWIAMVALLIKGICASLYYLLALKGNLSGTQSISDHGAAIQLNTLFVLSLAVWIYHSSLMKRLLFPLMTPFVILGYIAMQRRAAFITLAIAFMLLAALLYHSRRRLFALALATLSVGYVAISWNNQSFLAVPAQGIKSVIAADQASDRDQRSDNYRVLEDRNVNFTIHQHPFAGVGFGQKFHIIAPMPDISWFEWWEYITHNSIMWIWMKAGIGGFFSMLFLIGLAVVTGVRVLEGPPGDELSAVVLTATLYIVMHFIYACVDMSWDAQSMVYVGIMMGLVNSAERIGNPAANNATIGISGLGMSARAPFHSPPLANEP